MRLFLALPLLVLSGQALAQQGEAPKPKPVKQKKICKSTTETGSLVAKRKQCFTKTEWDKIAHSQQDGANRMVEDLRTKPSGGN